MSVQPRLVDVPAEPKLTERQQAAWDYVRSVPGGVTATAVGRNWYALTGRGHVPSVWHVGEGQDVLRSVALKPLVIRRQTGLWEPRNPKDRVREPSAQETGDLPDDLFGGP